MPSSVRNKRDRAFVWSSTTALFNKSVCSFSFGHIRTHSPLLGEGLPSFTICRYSGVRKNWKLLDHKTIFESLQILTTLGVHMQAFKSLNKTDYGPHFLLTFLPACLCCLFRIYSFVIKRIKTCIVKLLAKALLIWYAPYIWAAVFGPLHRNAA